MAIVRLASALARVQLVNEVTSAHVDEALRLITVSKSSLSRPKSSLPLVYYVILECFGTNQIMELSSIMETCINRGYIKSVINDCISTYETYNIWKVSGDMIHLK
jgi:DNA replication licensing factor MCM7